MPDSDRIFISYAEEDIEWLERFKAVLEPMVRNETISVWDKSQTIPGSERRVELEKALSQAKVAVLLVSINLLADNDIYQQELLPLLKLAEQKGLKILLLYLSSCLYEETEIKNYRLLNDVAQPLDLLPSGKQNQVLKDACQQIKNLVLGVKQGLLNQNYQQLESLLKQKNWKQADRETLRVMLKVSEQKWKGIFDPEHIGWLKPEDITNFKKEDLQIIDRLWKYYSQGHFGFSVQKEIWQNAGGKTNSYNQEVFKQFGIQVGWYELSINPVANMFKGGWLWFDDIDINFSKSVPPGYLPWSVLWNGPMGFKRNATNDFGFLNFGSQDTKDIFLALMKKLEESNL